MRAINHPATTQNVLTAIRFANNCFRTEELLEKIIFSHMKRIFSCLASVADQPMKPALCISICTFIMNFSISILHGKIDKKRTGAKSTSYFSGLCCNSLETLQPRMKVVK